MTTQHPLSYLALAIAFAAVSLATATHAVELDPAAVSVVTPEQFKWRDPTDRVATNQVNLHGDPNKAGEL
jgi:hypothetical protein